MKLWLKISLICIAVLLLVVGACSTLLLFSARDRILSATIDSAENEIKNIKVSFIGMMQYYTKEDAEPIVKYSLAKYCFSRVNLNDASALIAGDDTLQSNIGFDPQDFLPQPPLSKLDEDSPNHYMGTVSGRNVLIEGIQVTDLSDKYVIYVAKDITDVYKNIGKLIVWFCLISATGILAGIGLIIFLVRWTTKPLKDLSRSAKKIAQGNYAGRAAVSTRDEIGELARDFNAMADAVQSNYEELKEVAQRQQLFIGGLTHEFKTPLTSVIGHAETLLYTSMPEETAQNSLLHIHEQCRWLERLTQKLLKLVALNEEIEIKEESVQDLLGAVKESTAETLQKRGVSLEIGNTAGTLPMDFDLMQSLLINLVDNASKASAAGQTVEIRAYERTVEVTDSGIGMPAEELSRIAEPFYRVDKSRSKKMGGAGLGLALVQKIADAHGAGIAIESEPGKGTTVRVIFPG
jgi:signal transduction histidine kinase